MNSPDSRLAQLWPWIPTFRAVAETEHIGRAAERLHVVPSAVSRTLTLLEDRLGAPVFDRVGRRIKLNERGRGLLQAANYATEALERAVTAPRLAPFEGPLRLGSLGVLTNSVLLPVVLELRETYPAVLPSLKTVRASEAMHLLAARELDFACVYDPTALDGVVSVELGALDNAVYCGRGHPLFGKRVNQQRLIEHAFSAPMSGDSGTPMDNWPLDVPRRIGLRITLLSTNLDVSLSGAFVTVLPEVIAEPEVRAKRLWRLDRTLVPPTTAFAMFRASEHERVEVVELTRRLAQRVRDVRRLGRADRPRT